jgi:REP-associated tyrosine transposase
MSANSAAKTHHSLENVRKRHFMSLAGAERSSALQHGKLSPIMPSHQRYFAPGQLQFLTSSAYRRAKLFESDRFRRDFVAVLDQLRNELGFPLLGWVLMPEHFHLLIKPEPAAMTSRLMQELKKRTAQHILSALSENQRRAWCQKMLARLRLPPSVHSDSTFRVWQRRFYPFAVHSEEKRLEKLNYMHNNPVKRGARERSGSVALVEFPFLYSA